MNSTLSLQRIAAARTVQRRNGSIRCAANVTDVNSLPPPAVAASPPKGKAIELYIGHAKDQVKEKAEGVKGRFVVDDPAKYPERTEYVGGWAGGEQGLQDFVAAYKREIELNGAPPKVKYNKFSRQPEPIAKGSDTIYMGNGRVIQDDARRYPTRNELTGGFAGGELGLTVFKEIGDVPIAEDGQGTKQNSPLVTAFVLGLAATGGGLLLSTIQEVGVSVVEGGVPAANAVNATAGLGLDEKTRATLTAAILLVGVIGTVAGAQVLLDSMANKVRAGASKLAILGAFWVVVFLAAKLVLEG